MYHSCQVVDKSDIQICWINFFPVMLTQDFWSYLGYFTQVANICFSLPQDLLAIQKVQNKLIRFLNNKRISDKISTDTLISNINMTSVNRMNAQIKLTETWKAIKTEKCPLNIKVPTIDQNKRVARSSANGMLKTNGYSDGTKSTFINDSKKNVE